MLITIGRQYGAGGREVAELLAKELQLPLYDRKLVALIAEHLEKGCKLEELNLTYANLYGDESPYEHIFDNVIKNDDMFMFRPQAKAIRALADQKGDGIFVGRCANYILEDHNAFSFFIVANDDFRTTRGQLVYHKTLDDLKKEDKKRASYYNYYTSLNWGDAQDYDLVINTGKTGIEGAVKVIKDYVMSRSN